MAQLLVSVRNVVEAQLALDAGVDLIDIKEPLGGSLGAAGADTIAGVARRIAGRVPLSAALGELLEPQVARPLPEGLHFVKYGLAGCAARGDWPQLWRQRLAQLPAQVVPVAVAYADWHLAGAPSIEDVLELATEVGCGALLIDTFDKSAGNVLSHRSLDDLHRILQQAHSRQLMFVVAGSLGPRELTAILPLEPDVVAVRGAACAAQRTGTIDGEKLRAIVAQVHGARTCNTLGT